MRQRALRERPIQIIKTGADSLPPVQVGQHAPEIKQWLEKPDKQVTRAELWEMLHRYEAGRRRLELHNRRYYRWHRKLGRFCLAIGRAVYGYLTQPLIEQKTPDELAEPKTDGGMVVADPPPLIPPVPTL